MAHIWKGGGGGGGCWNWPTPVNYALRKASENSDNPDLIHKAEIYVTYTNCVIGLLTLLLLLVFGDFLQHHAVHVSPPQ